MRPTPAFLPVVALRALVVLTVASATLMAQDEPAAATGAQPPLAQFAPMQVAIMPVQLWKADTVGWSTTASWVGLRDRLDTAIGAALRDRGLGDRWTFGDDIKGTARRNRLYSGDPTALGVGRWRSAMPKAGDNLPQLAADNLRSLTAFGDARYALIPVELRGEGDLGVLRLVMADTRTRTVTFAVEIAATAGPSLTAALAERLADLIVEP